MGKTSTPYDDVFRTLLTDCRKLIIPVINEIFQENYTGEETITLKENELFLKYPNDKQRKRISDSSFIVSTERIAQHYHLECQSSPDGTMIIRIYEYDSQIALKEAKIIDNTLEVNFPQSAILYLRHNRNTPNALNMKISTPRGTITYPIPVLKIKKYDIETIFQKNLLFLLPFYIFIFEEQFPEMEKNKGKLQQLKEVYLKIQLRLNQLCETGKLDEYTKRTICSLAEKVISNLAVKYQTIKKEVTEIMGGKILEYEAKTILRNGIKIGQEDDIKKLLNKGLSAEEVSNLLDQDINLVKSIQSKMLQSS